MKEVYDPQRFDMGHEKWYKWIRDNKYKNDRRLHKRDREEVGSGRSRADSRSDEDVGRAAKSSRTSTLSAVAPGAPKARCEGCGRVGHVRESCRATDQFGFNPTGLWVDSRSYARIKAELVADGKPNSIPRLPRIRRSGKKTGDRDPPAPAVAKGRANSPPPPRAGSRERNRPLGGQSTSSAQTYGHNRTTTGRPGKSISFGKHPRIVHLSSIACECHDSDPDSVYRKYCVSVGTDQNTYYYVLFDTGVHPFSFVSRKVAAWIEAHQQRRRRREEGKKGGGSDRALSLAGTTQTTPAYGCVEFDLTFVNEVTNEPETIFSIHAKIIDSCIDIIISRHVIRENHLVHKLPHYFDEVSRSRPYMSHSTLPVTPSCEFTCLLYTSPSPRDRTRSRMPSSA